jgi:oligoendopeptidase F
VNSLYAVYEKSHEGFAERYLAMLSAGGTKHHSELLQPFGLDARDPSSGRGLERDRALIGELEGMNGSSERMNFHRDLW